MRPATKQYGTEVYEYVLLYTDDCLVVSENTESILENEIGRYFELKPDSIGPPSLYLDGHIQKLVLNTGSRLGILDLHNMFKQLSRTLKNTWQIMASH